MTRVLYDLVNHEERSFSPYCWRVKMALAHKNLEYTTELCRFSQIYEKIDNGLGLGDEMPPALVESAGSGERKVLAESMFIASYLESTYPSSGLGSLYTCPGSTYSAQEGKAIAERLHAHLEQTSGYIFNVVASDIARLLNDEDRVVFIQKRGARLQGTDVDEFTRSHRQSPDARSNIKLVLDPLRAQLGDKQFMLGDGPTLADYVAFGHFQWSRSVSPYILIGEDDTLFRWRERMLDLFGGLARNTPGYMLIPC